MEGIIRLISRGGRVLGPVHGLDSVMHSIASHTSHMSVVSVVSGYIEKSLFM